MYIQLTTEKEQAITIMASAILYFEDIVYPEPEEDEDEEEGPPPRPKSKIVLQGHAFNVQETSADIRAFLDDLDA